MIRNRFLVIIVACLSVLSTALRAQSYDTPEVWRFHESSIYYVTLQDANGRSINNQFAQTSRAIGAYVGGELRGVSEQLTVNPSNGQTVFAIRVWGDSNDPETVDFRVRSNGLEYLIATRSFAGGEEENYGSASQPIIIKFVPITELQLSPSSVSVLVGASVYLKPVLMPLNHSTLLTNLTYTFTATNNNGIFTVDNDGLIKGLASGQGSINVQAKDGNRTVFTASAPVSVLSSAVYVTGIRNDLPSLQIKKNIGEDFLLAFTLLPENATNHKVTYQLGDYDVLTYIEDERGVATFKGLKSGTTTITVISEDNTDVKLTYEVTITDPNVHATAITIKDDYQTITVDKNDWQTLTNALAKAYTLTPANASDEVAWRPEDTNIVEPLIGSEGWNPANVGQTEMVACILNEDGSIRLSDTLTVNVEPTVENIYLWNDSFRALIGDTISNPLQRIYYIEPVNVKNQDITFSIVNGTSLEKMSSGHIIARRPGTATVRLTSVANPAVTADVTVTVMNPATGIDIKKDTLRFDLRDQSTFMEMADAFKANVEFTPKGFEYFGDRDMMIGDCPRFMSSDDAILSVGSFQGNTPTDYELMVNASGGGIVTVTVQLEVPDYMTYAHEPGSMVMMKYVEKSFVVVLTQYAQGIYLDPEFNMNVGDKLDLNSRIQTWPEGSVYDPSKIEWSLMREEDKEIVKIEKGVVTALAPCPEGVIINGNDTETGFYVSTMIFIMNPAKTLSVRSGYEAITVDKGDWQTLTDAIDNAFVVEPANHTDYIEISFDPEGHINQLWDDYSWRNIYTPEYGGDCYVIATIYGDEYDENWNRIPRLQAKIKVTIEVGLESISLMRNSIKLKPGDNIAPKLSELVYFWPADATHKDLTFKVLDNKILKTNDKGDIIAEQTGTGRIVISATNKPALTDTLTVKVVNPATGIVIKKELLEFEYSRMNPDDWTRIGNAIKNNISFTPANYDFFGDPDMMSVAHYPLFDTSDNGILYLSAFESWENNDPRDYHLECNPNGGGIVTVTVRLQIPDYVNAATNFDGNAEPEKTVEETFKVKLLPLVEWLDVQYPVMVEEGESINLKDYVTPMPENCLMHWEDLEFKLGDMEGEEYISMDTSGHVIALKPKKSGVHVDIRLNDLGIFASTNVIVTRTAKTMTVKTGYETIVIDKGDDKTLNKMLSEALEIMPEGFTDDVFWESTNETVVQPIRNFFGEYTFKTNGVGIADLTATIYAYKDGDVDTSNPRLQVKIKVKVIQPLIEVAITAPATMMVGVPAEITITPNKGSSIEATTAKLTETGGYKWPILSYDKKTENNDGTLTVTVTPLVPATFTVQLNYQELKSETKSIEITLPTTLTKGWQWMTLWGNNVNKNPEEVFGNNADEVRSQTDLLSRDTKEGWFGTLELAPGKAYMVNANTNVAASKAFQQTKGSFLTMKQNVTLYNGWTWLAYPYVNAFTPENLKLTPTAGDRIVSKSDGFVEYSNGKWTGTLTTLSPFSTYLYYNNAGKAATLTWSSESSIYSAAHPAAAREINLVDISDETEATSLNSRLSPLTSHWEYDHTAYRNNMTMIARIDAGGENVLTTAETDRYTIGAFVGSECRGEGRSIDGLMFITVHANAGELVSFRLYDSQKDFEFTVNEQVVASMMLGSISHPYPLTFDKTQGIEAVNSEQFTVNSYYDLQGRKRSAHDTKQSTILLERQANGNYKKVVVR